MDYADKTTLDNLSGEQLQQQLKKFQIYCKLFSTLDTSWRIDRYPLTYAVGAFMMDNTRSRKERLKTLEVFALWQDKALTIYTFIEEIKELRRHYEAQAIQLRLLIDEKTA